MSTDTEPLHDDTVEPRDAGNASKLNWLRADVLGANDGIVSVAAIVVGVAGATDGPAAIFTGATSAWIGGTHRLRPTVRVVIGGALALAATFIIGTLLGNSGVI